MRTITIVVRDDNDFTVHEGTHFIDRLCWDELLGTLAVLTHPILNKIEPRVPPYRMKNMDELREDERELRRRIRELEEINIAKDNTIIRQNDALVEKAIAAAPDVSPSATRPRAW